MNVEFQTFSFPMWTNVITVTDNGMFQIGPYQYRVDLVSSKWPSPNEVQQTILNAVNTEKPYAIICDDEFLHGKPTTVINGEARFIPADMYLDYYDINVNDVLNVARANHNFSIY